MRNQGIRPHNCTCNHDCEQIRLEGYLAWATLSVFVASFDFVAKRVGGMTLSEAFERIRRRPLRHAVAFGVWTLLTIHLFKKEA